MYHISIYHTYIAKTRQTNWKGSQKGLCRIWLAKRDLVHLDNNGQCFGSSPGKSYHFLESLPVPQKDAKTRPDVRAERCSARVWLGTIYVWRKVEITSGQWGREELKGFPIFTDFTSWLRRYENRAWGLGSVIACWWDYWKPKDPFQILRNNCLWSINSRFTRLECLFMGSWTKGTLNICQIHRLPFHDGSAHGKHHPYPILLTFYQPAAYPREFHLSHQALYRRWKFWPWTCFIPTGLLVHRDCLLDKKTPCSRSYTTNMHKKTVLGF